MSDIAAIRNRGRWLLGRGQEIARQPLFANAGYLFGINVLNGGVGFVFWGLAARLYTAEDIGLGSAIISAVT
ncbi:MAG: hypothetical protein GX601_09785, partial [Anaerolineales bacterium]|nr:hypothetical protein [Anaerolineales bacterium]